MLKKYSLMLLGALFFVSCASSKSVVNNDPELTNDVMVTFLQRAQSGFWKEAMENVTPDERDEMMENGQVLAEYKNAVARVRLSTIRNMKIGLDNKGRLVGLKDVLDESNTFFDENEGSTIDLGELGKERPASEKAKKASPKEKGETAENDSTKTDEFSSFIEGLIKEASGDTTSVPLDDSSKVAATDSIPKPEKESSEVVDDMIKKDLATSDSTSASEAAEEAMEQDTELQEEDSESSLETLD